MNTVLPLMDRQLVRAIREKLSQYTTPREQRMYLLFVSGIYLGLRISDLLKLKVYQLYNQSELHIREKKTGKENIVPINKDLQKIYKQELKDCDPTDFVFVSHLRDKAKRLKAISRKTAYNDINKICKEAGFYECVGCHTLRKTFGYFMYDTTKDIAVVMDWLNHTDPKVTMRYIGLTLDNRKSAAEKLRF